MTTQPKFMGDASSRLERRNFAMLPSMEGDQPHLILDANAKHTGTSYNEENVPDHVWKSDAQGLPLSKLKEKYPLTFSSFQNTVYGRGRGPGGEVKHYIRPEVQHFRGFLQQFGPRRKPELTLDRHDASNPCYGPGLCEWRDKKRQARNRKSTIIVEHPATGEAVPLIQLADEWEVDPQRLRRWHREGFSTNEMRRAIQYGTSPSRLRTGTQWPWSLNDDQLNFWEHSYRCGRRAANARDYEVRAEFAVRRLEALIRQEAEWLTTTWEQCIDPDPRVGEDIDDLPAEVRSEFERRLALKAHLEARLAAAREAVLAIDPWAKRDRLPADQI